MQTSDISSELNSVKAYKVLLAHLRAGGLKYDRLGTEGENLDHLPPNPGQDFLVQINGHHDYRLTLGLRSLRLFCRLEFLGRRRGKVSVELDRGVNSGSWLVRAEEEMTGFTLKHPFAIFVFSCDHLAVSVLRLRSTLHESCVEERFATLAKLFETGALPIP